MKKLKKYFVNESDDNICYRVSLVDEPAVESEFVYMSKQDGRKEYVSLENNEKKMVYSATLVPDKPIYRNLDGEEFDVIFTAAAIERMAKNFMKAGFNHDWSLDHDGQSVSGLTAVECWIKSDMEKDKSVAIGLDPELPVGTWFLGLSVDNPDVWKAIKEGTWHGFSVEALITLDEIKMAKDMNEKENVKLETVEVNEGFWQRLVNIIKEALGSPEQPAEEAEEQAVEVVEEVKEEVVEETPAEENLEEETPVEEVAEEAAAVAEEVAEESTPDPEAEKAALEETITRLEEKIDELNGEIEELKKQNQKLSKQPSTKEIKAGAQRTHAETMDILRQLHGQK